MSLSQSWGPQEAAAALGWGRGQVVQRGGWGAQQLKQQAGPQQPCAEPEVQPVLLQAAGGCWGLQKPWPDPGGRGPTLQAAWEAGLLQLPCGTVLPGPLRR